jgi:hypothetical protein
MLASKITAETLRAAADQVGVKVDITTLSGSGLRHRVKVLPIVPPECYTPAGHRRKGDKGNAPYQRESVGYFTGGRRVHAVCWHGFRDFFRAAFAIEPNAIFRTALDTWNGSADFEARYRKSGYKTKGPPIAPASEVDACRCSEAGEAN